MLAITTEAATGILREHVAPGLNVTAVKRMAGGMINTVQEWITDGEPRSVVAKLTPQPDHAGLLNEFHTLAWYRRHTEFPVPQPYACVSGQPGLAGTCLLMERIPGRNLGEARLSPRGAEHCERQLATHLVKLHGHKRDTYGNALGGTTYARHLDLFAPALEYEFKAVRSQLPAASRKTVERLLAHLDEWLPETGDPTLVHGDIWATNIIVDDVDPDAPQIRAFIDMGANYRDVEQELAYLLIFHTAGATFFGEYRQVHPLRPGFERRCRVYWLNTWLLHVRLFGEGYLASAERTIREIERLA